MTSGSQLPSAGSETAQEFLSGKLSHVDVAAIEKELKALWKKAAADGSSATSTVMRACSFNMVVVSEDDDAESVCSDILDELLVQRPGRGILAIYRQEKPARLDAWVSARCHLEGASKQICAEQITVCCEGGEPKQLASVVLPLILPELPVFIYWRRDFDNDAVFEALSQCASRFIVDSMRQPFDLHQLKRTDLFMQKMRGCSRTSDLNWRRIGGWLRAFADAFDGFPLSPDYLKRFSRLTVSAGKSTVPTDGFASTQGLLLVGWLASRLGWKLSQGLTDNLLSFESAEGTPITIEFVGSPSGKPGYLGCVGCQFDDSTTLTVSAQHVEGLSYIVAHASATDAKEVTRASYDLDESTLLGQEVDNLFSDPIYEAAVSAVSTTLP